MKHLHPIMALALSGILAVAEKNDPDCPDCKRKKARSADDCAAGLCPKWYAVRDPEAAADCERYPRCPHFQTCMEKGCSRECHAVPSEERKHG